MRAKIIPYQIYPFDVIVSYQTLEGIKKTLRGLLPDDIHDELDELDHCTDARTIMFSGGQTVIWFNKDPSYGLISHEVFHAVTYLMDRIGVTLSPSSDEAYAYAVQYLTNEIYSFITPKK